MNRFCLAFLFAFLGIVSNATAANLQCLADIGANDATFITPMYNDVLAGQAPTQENIDANKPKMFGLVAANVILQCLNGPDRNDFQTVADSKEFIIPFSYKDKVKYKLQVDTAKLFDYVNLPTGFLVVNKRTYIPGDVIKKSDMPTDYFFSSDCSDHYVRLNLSDDAGVNVAGQSAFAAYGGKENEYFLDFPVEKNCRAFPGLVLGDFGGWGAPEKIIAYTNYLDAQGAAESFAKALQNTSCANQNLAVYLVSLESMPAQKDGTTGIVIGAGVGGGAAAATLTAVLASNPVGWVVGAVGLAVGGIVAGVSSLFYKDLADIQQVVVLKGPYIVK